MDIFLWSKTKPNKKTITRCKREIWNGKVDDLLPRGNISLRISKKSRKTISRVLKGVVNIWQNSWAVSTFIRKVLRPIFITRSYLYSAEIHVSDIKSKCTAIFCFEIFMNSIYLPPISLQDFKRVVDNSLHDRKSGRKWRLVHLPIIVIKTLTYLLTYNDVWQASCRLTIRQW